ncbi:DoxX family protein [Frigidibacter sp. SD6-1]|uniref:DoxX family protein n=1 Tax=Frigidibacter sp. SD6-1 TaxID=3032581 RepID=UPI0024DFB43E|nr:DoxX family protein [Frigidibacter sp. SD6-1]
MSASVSLVVPLARLFLSLIFIISGLGKIAGYAGVAQYMQAMGVPGALLPVVILTEIACGVALLVGWQARIAAFLLAGFSLLSGIVFHLVPAGGLEGMAAQAEITSFLKNVAIAGGLLMVTATGAGRLSLDARRGDQ